MFGSRSAVQGQGDGNASASPESFYRSMSLQLAAAVLATIPLSINERAFAVEPDKAQKADAVASLADMRLAVDFQCVDRTGRSGNVFHRSGTLVKVSEEGFFFVDSAGKEGFLAHNDVMKATFAKSSQVEAVERPLMGAGVTVAFVDGSHILAEDVSMSGREVKIQVQGVELTASTRGIQYIRFSTGNQFDQSWADIVARQEDAISNVVLKRPAGLDYVAAAIDSIGAESVTIILDDQRISPKRSGKLEGIIFRPASEKEPLPRGEVKPEVICEVKGDFGRVPASKISLDPKGMVCIATPAGLTMELSISQIAALDYSPGMSKHLDTISHKVIGWNPIASIENEQSRLDSMLTGSTSSIRVGDVRCEHTVHRNAITFAEGVSCEFYTRGFFDRLIGSAGIPDDVLSGSSVLTISDGDTVLFEKEFSADPAHALPQEKSFLGGFLGTPGKTGPVKLNVPIADTRRITISVKGDIPLTLIEPLILETAPEK